MHYLFRGVFPNNSVASATPSTQPQHPQQPLHAPSQIGPFPKFPPISTPLLILSLARAPPVQPQPLFPAPLQPQSQPSSQPQTSRPASLAPGEWNSDAAWSLVIELDGDIVAALATELRHLKRQLVDANLTTHAFASHLGVLHLEEALADVRARGTATYVPIVRASENLNAAAARRAANSSVYGRQWQRPSRRPRSQRRPPSPLPIAPYPPWTRQARIRSQSARRNNAPAPSLIGAPPPPSISAPTITTPVTTTGPLYPMLLAPLLLLHPCSFSPPLLRPPHNNDDNSNSNNRNNSNNNNNNNNSPTLPTTTPTRTLTTTLPLIG